MITTQLLLLSSILVGSAFCDPHYGAENVCNQTITVRKEISVEEPVKYILEYQGMCGILPCTKTRTEVRMNSKLKTILKEKEIATCCPGYAETPERKCAPICIDSCNNGKCISPGICKCVVEPTNSSPGFVGSRCNRFQCLAVDRWGLNCERECNCPDNSYCSASTGKCLCHSGWQGVNCTEECNSKTACGDVELPPIIEPEANMIHGTYGTSQKLEALSLKASERDSDVETNQQIRSATSLVVLHMELNLFLTILVFSLVFLAVYHRKRINGLLRLVRESQYAAPSTRGNSSNYSSESFYSLGPNPTVQNRPLPNPIEPNLLSKNLNFASATRNILLKGTPGLNKQADNRDKIIGDPKVEEHLISSQQSSKKNIYSELNISDNSCNMETSDSTVLSFIPEDKMLNISLSSDEHEYQVPRYSPNNSVNMSPPTTLRQVNLDGPQHEFDLYANDQSNHYEELKPRSPGKRQ